jgi:hypothetical protein
VAREQISSTVIDGTRTRHSRGQVAVLVGTVHLDRKRVGDLQPVLDDVEVEPSFEPP